MPKARLLPPAEATESTEGIFTFTFRHAVITIPLIIVTAFAVGYIYIKNNSLEQTLDAKNSTTSATLVKPSRDNQLALPLVSHAQQPKLTSDILTSGFPPTASTDPTSPIDPASPAGSLQSSSSNPSPADTSSLQAPRSPSNLDVLAL